MDLKNTIINTEYGIDLISSGINITNIKESENIERREKLFNDIEKLYNAYDYIILDCPSGISDEIEFFFSKSNIIILIANPEVTSLTDVYRMIKVINNEDYAESISIVINKVKNI